MTMKVILKLDYTEDKTKQKAMKKVSGLSGVESIALDAKGKKLTVSGDIDPIDVVAKLTKICYADIVSVGPAKDKEPEKEAADGKKDEPQNKDDVAAAKLLEAYSQAQQPYYFQPELAAAVGLPASYPTYYQRSVEEDPNGCAIC